MRPTHHYINSSGAWDAPYKTTRLHREVAGIYERGLINKGENWDYFRERKTEPSPITGKGIPAEEIGLEVSIHNEATTFFSAKTNEKTLHKVGVISPERLDKLIRKSDLIAEFAKALKEIRAKEKASGDYPIVWNLQN